MRILDNGLGMVQTETQEISETIEALQQNGPQTSTPKPPEPHTVPRPERAAGDRRRTTTAEPDADDAASAVTGSETPVTELVQAIQTAQQDADKIELPNIPGGNQFRTWHIAVREAVASASRDPKAAFLWARKVEATTATSVDFAETDGLRPSIRSWQAPCARSSQFHLAGAST